MAKAKKSAPKKAAPKKAAAKKAAPKKAARKRGKAASAQLALPMSSARFPFSKPLLALPPSSTRGGAIVLASEPGPLARRGSSALATRSAGALATRFDPKTGAYVVVAPRAKSKAKSTPKAKPKARPSAKGVRRGFVFYDVRNREWVLAEYFVNLKTRKGGARILGRYSSAEAAVQAGRKLGLDRIKILKKGITPEGMKPTRKSKASKTKKASTRSKARSAKKTKRKPKPRRRSESSILHVEGDLKVSRAGRKPVKRKPVKRKPVKRKPVKRKPAARKTPGRSASAKAKLKKLGVAPGAFERLPEGGVKPHARGTRNGLGVLKCVKCARVHTLREHWSHKMIHGQQQTQASYKCSRGGICEFQEMVASRKPKVRKALRRGEPQVKRLAEANKGKLSVKKLAEVIVLQKRMEDLARRSKR